jgi:phosphatidylglycerophosphate synthase
MWFTWANLLTAVRLLCIGPTAWAIVEARWVLAAWLFVLAVITDLADGPVARRLNETSPRGGLFDHLTDALYVSAALAALSVAGFVPVLLPVLVLLAFTQYMFDSRALAGAELRTSFLGRNNGVAYFVLTGIPVIREGLGWSWPPDAWITAFAWVLIATTLASMADRALAFVRQRSARK